MLLDTLIHKTSDRIYHKDACAADVFTLGTQRKPSIGSPLQIGGLIPLVRAADSEPSSHASPLPRGIFGYGLMKKRVIKTHRRRFDPSSDHHIGQLHVSVGRELAIVTLDELLVGPGCRFGFWAESLGLFGATLCGRARDVSARQEIHFFHQLRPCSSGSVPRHSESPASQWPLSPCSPVAYSKKQMPQ